MYRFLLLAFIAMVTGPVVGFAQSTTPASGSSNSATTPDEAVKTPAGKFIADLGAQAVQVVADKSLGEDARMKKYHQLLNQAFDMQTIAHFVAGRAFNAAPPEQQQEYLKLFETIVLNTYGQRLDFYSGETFRVKSVRQESEKDSIVSSEITHPDGSAPTKIDWRVRSANGKTAIIDVVVEGVSQSVTQRDEYGAIIQRDNGKLDGLLVLMRKQAAAGPASTAVQNP